jgi:hypothetical protein
MIIRRPSLMVLAACLLSGGAAAAAGAVPTEAGKPQTQPLPGNGFQLAYPYWMPPGHGPQKALVGRYTWNAQPVRTATAVLDKHSSAEPKDWRWVFTFADQPQPNELARIDLLYEFELTAVDQSAIADAARTLAEATVQAYADATTAAKGDATAFQRELDSRAATVAASPAADTLKKFSDEQGSDGLTLFLGALGIEQPPSGGWKVAATATDRLAQLAGALVAALLPTELEKKDDAAALAVLAKPPTPANDCSKVAGDGSALVHDLVLAGKVLSACGAQLVADMNALAASDETGDQTNGKTKAAALREAALTLQSKLGAPLVGTPLETAAKADPAIAGWYSYNAARLAKSTVRRANQDVAWSAARDGLVKGAVVAVERASVVQPGSTIIAGGLKARRYDISTGVVYVRGLRNMVIPTMISVCGWEGCLKQNEAMWDAPNGGGRSFSLDAGIRVKTLGTKDPRQSDDNTPSFVMGLSWNPLSVFRLSAGAYVFENAQTRNWNMQPYIGATFNVLNAAELLGGLGLGPQFAPLTNETH